MTVVNGGYLPDSRRGQVESGMMHIADWYVTWCSMLGIDYTDTMAVQSGMPDVEGYNMWPLISGETKESPRTEIAVSRSTFISGDLKLCMRDMGYPMWTEAVWPDKNSSVEGGPKLECSATNPCLFNVTGDPSECMSSTKDSVLFKHLIDCCECL